MKRDRAVIALAIVALAGTTTAASANDWALPIDGNWNTAANWLGADVPDTIVEDAVLGLVGPYLVTITNNFTHGGISITNPDATLSLANIFHTINGDLFNDGTLVINTNAVVFNSHLAFNSDANISGNGIITLNGANGAEDAQIIVNAPFTVTHGAAHTINGAGRISGNMINDGLIVADSIAGPLQLNGVLTQSATGQAGADLGGTLELMNGSITTGGVLTTGASSSINVAGSMATIGDLTNQGAINIPGSGYFLVINEDVVNDGTITVNSSDTVFNAHIRFVADAILSGTGVVLMDISSGDQNDAQLLTEVGITGTIGPDQTVQGSGLIATPSDGLIINQGIINGNDPDDGLALAGNHEGSAGVYRSDNGTIFLRNGLILNGGAFESTGTGSFAMTTSGTAIISDVVSNSQINIQGSGGFIQLAGPMTNNGSISINSNMNIFNAHLITEIDTLIDGSGTIEMFNSTDINDAQIFTRAAVTLTLGANQVVSGSGLISGGSDGTIVNLGVINANHPAMGKEPAKELRLFGNHSGNSAGVYRSDDGLLGLGNGLILDNATFDSSGVGLVEVANSSTATVSDITNLGELGIRGNGSFLSLTGPMVNNGTITVNSNIEIFNAHLTFENTLASLTGTGNVRMQIASQLNDAQFFTTGVFDALIGAGQTIAGAGLVDGRSGGTIVNNGIIDGDDPINELRLGGNHDGSGGGVYRSTNGMLGLSNGLVMNGGTFQTAGTGSVSMITSGIAQVGSMTNEGNIDLLGNGGILELTGPLTNNGAIDINSNLNIFNAHIRFEADTMIDGNGTINMSTSTQSNDAQIIATAGFVGVLGSGQDLTGDGQLVGELEINGGIDPAGPTRNFFINTMRFSSTTDMTADLGGLLAGEFDRLILGGSDSIELAGDLTVNLDAGYVPVFGDTWDIIDGGSITGLFDTTNMPTAGLGQIYRVIYESDRVYVVLTCDADLTGDNVLDFFDISAFLSFFGGGDTRADINLDGSFDFFDLSLFLQIFTGSCD